ncbi:MAG: ArsA-related P-loop ATPase, partial [Myxococcota bacterium]|nr:ArsA-related P-loop ATPase [Myxococcota bacterium]
GVDALDNEPTRIPIDRFEEVGLHPKGELWAMMLDMKKSFDHLVDRHAPDEKSRQAILNNKLYQYFSTSLAGTQEYAAAERLYEIYTGGEYDLIVLDTPPTSHALDFLEAPNRLVDAINSRAMQFLYRPTSGLLSVGTNYVIKTLSRFTGGEMLSELGTFLKAFSTLFAGFQERAGKVRELMTSDVTTFTVITAPTAGNIDEAIYFHKKLGADHARVGGFVTNRVHPAWVPRAELSRPSGQLSRELSGLSEAYDALERDAQKEFARKIRGNATDFQVLADLDEEAIMHLRDTIPRSIPIMRVPYFAHDIHSLAGLDHVRRSLFVA